MQCHCSQLFHMFLWHKLTFCNTNSKSPLKKMAYIVEILWIWLLWMLVQFVIKLNWCILNGTIIKKWKNWPTKAAFMLFILWTFGFWQVWQKQEPYKFPLVINKALHVWFRNRLTFKALSPFFLLFLPGEHPVLNNSYNGNLDLDTIIMTWLSSFGN